MAVCWSVYVKKIAENCPKTLILGVLGDVFDKAHPLKNNFWKEWKNFWESLYVSAPFKFNVKPISISEDIGMLTMKH